MGYWVEIHCDSRTSKDCLSNKNEGPGGMATGTTTILRNVQSILIKEALLGGWVKKGSNFFCPNCTLALLKKSV